jgi:L-aspartate oxidase
MYQNKAKKESSLQYDVVVVGSGLAGLSAALGVCHQASVAVICKDKLGVSNSAWAQGGIAAAVSEQDSPDEHLQDTLEAGANLCDVRASRTVLESGPSAIQFLEDCGVAFTRDGQGYDLGREGGHHQRRILHAGDITGRKIQDALVDEVRRSPIEIYENTMAIDLVRNDRVGGGPPDRVRGLYALDPAGEVQAFQARVVILATGGAGKVYLYTTNPDAATGDGLAMGLRAGLPAANMEFYQFHPTCLYHPDAKNFLLSEALRGEGAKIFSKNGTRILDSVHPLKELAPRDVVARAIDAYLKKSGDDAVYLDCTPDCVENVSGRFPNLYARCLQFGFDMNTDRVPVVPAAHYQCGGLLATVEGETDCKNLFAIGEVACTGLHGANRLASNSLLEAVVQGMMCSERVLAEVRDGPNTPIPIPEWQYGDGDEEKEEVYVSHIWEELRRMMWNYVGIVRTHRRLKQASKRLRMIVEEIHGLYWERRPTRDLLELRNLATVAESVITCANFRRESRGLHYNRDFPEILKQWKGWSIYMPDERACRFESLSEGE